MEDEGRGLRESREPVVEAVTGPLRADLPSAWAFGAYKRGMGKDDAHYRERFAVEAIKRELAVHGYKVNLATTVFGGAVDRAVREFQESQALVVDGLVGKKTTNALFRDRLNEDIPDGHLRALVHWESLDDPGAEFVNDDNTFDRGLCMLNSTRKPLSMDEAFDPESAVTYAANYIRTMARHFRSAGCSSTAPSHWLLAISSWRTPVGARNWCELGDEVVATPYGSPGWTWAGVARHYAEKVDTVGRMNWVG